MKTACKTTVYLLALMPLGVLLILAVPEFPALRRLADYRQGYGRSLLLTVPVVTLQLLVAVPAAYALTRWRKRGHFLYCLLTLLPCQVMLLPNYLVCRMLGILHTPLALLLPGIFSPLSVYLLSRQMQRIGREQAEAAALDGAGESVILRSIYLPQVRGTVCIAGGLAFLDCWSMVELPAVLLPENKPLSLLLAGPDFPAPCAGSLLYLLPAAIAFAALSMIKSTEI